MNCVVIHNAVRSETSSDAAMDTAMAVPPYSRPSSRARWFSTVNRKCPGSPAAVIPRKSTSEDIGAP